MNTCSICIEETNNIVKVCNTCSNHVCNSCINNFINLLFKSGNKCYICRKNISNKYINNYHNNKNLNNTLINT